MAKQEVSSVHENFDPEKSSKSRLKVIRQDRVSIEHLDCHLEIRNLRYKVVNISAFGLLVKTDALEEGIDELMCPLIVENIELGQLNLRLVREQNNPLGIPKLVAFEIIGQPFDIERIYAVEKSAQIIAGSTSYQSATRRIPDLFARKVYEIKDWLEELKNSMTLMESDAATKDTFRKNEFEETFVQIMGDYFNKVMPVKNNDLNALISDYNSNIIKDCYEFFRDKLKALIYQAPFSDRVYNKPLGYAGDFEMMNIIYRSKPEGDTLFAKCLHDYWVKQPAAQAVRNRAQYIKSSILKFVGNSDKGVKFLSVASGPAREWQELIVEGQLINRQITVDLLDQDENALKYSQRILRDKLTGIDSNIRFNYVNKAIKNIIVKGLAEKYDFIYSAGLFDYFSDPVAQLAASKLYEALNPGGKLIIGNFNVANPNSVIMDLALDWHLIYRSQEDLKRLYAHNCDEFEIEAEDLAINLFCVISKKNDSA